LTFFHFNSIRYVTHRGEAYFEEKEGAATPALVRVLEQKAECLIAVA